MTIYEELESDHDLVLSLLDELKDCEDVEVRKDLINQVRDALVPHSRAEEAVFYNVLREMDDAKKLIAHSYQEHLMAEGLLRGLQVTEAVSINWKSGVEKLRESLAHHIAQEEGEIFSEAKQLLSDQEAETLGEAFVQLKPKLGANVVSSQMDLMVNLMPMRFREGFSKFMNRRHDDTPSQKAS